MRYLKKIYCINENYGAFCDNYADDDAFNTDIDYSDNNDMVESYFLYWTYVFLFMVILMVVFKLMMVIRDVLLDYLLGRDSLSLGVVSLVVYGSSVPDSHESAEG